MSETGIGTIGVIVREQGGKFYWGRVEFDSVQWEEIPQDLYQSLISYENERTGAE